MLRSELLGDYEPTAPLAQILREHLAGSTDDVAFVEAGAHYITLEPGETIVSTCTFQNMGSRTVGFGTSTDQEMCYQFAVSYPAHALDNGVISLIGASNTCWQFGE